METTPSQQNENRIKELEARLDKFETMYAGLCQEYDELKATIAGILNDRETIAANQLNMLDELEDIQNSYRKHATRILDEMVDRELVPVYEEGLDNIQLDDAIVEAAIYECDWCRK
jgi:gamma-glutamylcyclotransferase (GGCT)/AIG2-like uncharacterized protein YtfP